MNTGSTASSGTERPEPEESRGAEPPPLDGAVEPQPGKAEHDPGRRAFFFEFGKQAVTAAGQVAGMADLVGRSSGGSVANLLGLGSAAAPAARPAFARSGRSAVVSAAAPAAEDSFRSPYRLAGDELVLLDQRGIPETLDEVAAKRGSDVAYYLRLGVSRGGSLMAQLAAYGLALTAHERATQPAELRDAELHRTMGALVGSRPSSRLLSWSMERMGAAASDLGDAADGNRLAAVLRAEADAIATDLGAWNSVVGEVLRDELARSGSRSLGLLLHGGHGALAGGSVGSGLSALRRLRDAGWALRVFVTEGRPFMDGARLTSWELRQAGIEHKVIPDNAVAWLLGREAIDAVLISAEWVAANGDTGALLGSRAVAQIAAAAGTRVLITGVSATIDPATSDGAAIPEEMLLARDLAAYLADVPIRDSDALAPAADVIPAAAISLLITERGTIKPGEAG